MTTWVLLLSYLATGQTAPVPAARPEPALPAPDEVRAALARSVEFLLQAQNPDGSWGSAASAKVGIDEFWTNPETHRSWRYAVTGLVCMTMQRAGLDGRAGPAFDRGVDYLVAHVDVKRPGDWDTDNVWAYVYGLQAVADAYVDPRLAGSPRRDALRRTADTLIAKLKKYQTPSGGWGYYDFEVYAQPGMWATSFTTAVGLLALVSARDAGFEVEPRMIEEATRAVRRCRLPTGAYTYSVDPLPTMIQSEGINQIKGSLGRIQVCNHALRRAGVDVPLDEVRRGLTLFFHEHRFLDIARLRPIPHEAYYYNSGYFYFFGHVYAADMIAALPAEERLRLWPRLQYEIIKTQERDGAMWDYPMASYDKSYGTAFAAIALARSLNDYPHPLDVEGRAVAPPPVPSPAGNAPPQPRP